MSRDFSDEEWQAILNIARSALELPKEDRSRFIEQQATDPELAREALNLAEELEEPEEDTPGLLGTSIGRFILMDYLGSGGAGDVYSARDQELGRTVAIKLLKQESLPMQDAEKRFVREAQAVSALNHPNIVTIHEVIRRDSQLAIVMELVAGAPLREKCGGPLSDAEVLNIGIQIADALMAAHAAGVVHRDIKPENVMVLPDGLIKVLDFGLARSSITAREASVSLAAGLRAGTLRYMSPEHFHEQPLTAQTDIFALGIVLYELATGRYPFQKDSPLEVLHAIASEEPTSPARLNPAMSPALASTILAMMAKAPEVRPSAVRVAEALNQIRNPPEAAPNLGAHPKRKWQLLAGAVILVMALGAAVWRHYRFP